MDTHFLVVEISFTYSSHMEPVWYIDQICPAMNKDTKQDGTNRKSCQEKSFKINKIC